MIAEIGDTLEYMQRHRKKYAKRLAELEVERKKKAAESAANGRIDSIVNVYGQSVDGPSKSGAE